MPGAQAVGVEPEAAMVHQREIGAVVGRVGHRDAVVARVALAERDGLVAEWMPIVPASISSRVIRHSTGSPAP